MQTPDGFPSEVSVVGTPSGFSECESVSLFSVSRCDWVLSFLLEGIPYDIGLSLSDWLCFLGSSLGPSLSLPVAFFPFVWMACAFPLYVCTTSCCPGLCLFPCWLLPWFGSWKQCCHEGWSARVFSSVVSSGNRPKDVCSRSYAISFLRILRHWSAVLYSGC